MEWIIQQLPNGINMGILFALTVQIVIMRTDINWIKQFLKGDIQTWPPNPKPPQIKKRWMK